jgi:glycine cleavage system transcriptional repressor
MNRAQLLVTAAGPDRIGFVDEITGVLVHHGANIEESRMARLAGDFAALMLVSVSENQIEPLLADLGGLRRRDMEVSARRLLGGELDVFKDYLAYAITVTGADHEGIIRNVAHQLTQMGINIAELESDVENAPTTGTPLFNMKAILQVPPDLSIAIVKENLRRTANEMSVLIRIEEN